jgi:hypothetical protein
MTGPTGADRVRNDEPTSPPAAEAAEGPRAPAGRNSPRLWTVALLLLVPATCLALARWVSAWLIAPYLLLMAWLLWPSRPALRKDDQESGPGIDAGAADPADRADPAGEAGAGDGRPVPAPSPSESGDGAPTPGDAPASPEPSTATKTRRAKTRARAKSRPAVESVAITWVQVGPGKFVRMEGGSAEIPSAGESAPLDPPALSVDAEPAVSDPLSGATSPDEPGLDTALADRSSDGSDDPTGESGPPDVDPLVREESSSGAPDPQVDPEPAEPGAEAITESMPAAFPADDPVGNDLEAGSEGDSAGGCPGAQEIGLPQDESWNGPPPSSETASAPTIPEEPDVCDPGEHGDKDKDQSEDSGTAPEARASSITAWDTWASAVEYPGGNEAFGLAPLEGTLETYASTHTGDTGEAPTPGIRVEEMPGVQGPSGTASLHFHPCGGDDEGPAPRAAERPFPQAEDEAGAAEAAASGRGADPGLEIAEAPSDPKDRGELWPQTVSAWWDRSHQVRSRVSRAHPCRRGRRTDRSASRSTKQSRRIRLRTRSFSPRAPPRPSHGRERQNQSWRRLTATAPLGLCSFSFSLL